MYIRDLGAIRITCVIRAIHVAHLFRVAGFTRDSSGRPAPRAEAPLFRWRDRRRFAASQAYCCSTSRAISAGSENVSSGISTLCSTLSISSSKRNCDPDMVILNGTLTPSTSR